MDPITLDDAKRLVLAAWSGDEWWHGLPITTGAVTDCGDRWLIEVGLVAYLVDGNFGAMMPDSPFALVRKDDGSIERVDDWRIALDLVELYGD